MQKPFDIALSQLEDVAKGDKYYYVTTSDGSVSSAICISYWLEDKLNAALNNTFVSEEAAKAHADEVIKKYEKVIAYAETL